MWVYCFICDINLSGNATLTTWSVLQNFDGTGINQENCFVQQSPIYWKHTSFWNYWKVSESDWWLLLFRHQMKRWQCYYNRSGDIWLVILSSCRVAAEIIPRHRTWASGNGRLREAWSSKNCFLCNKLPPTFFCTVKRYSANSLRMWVSQKHHVSRLDSK